MTADEYWNGSLWLARYYRDAEILKRKQQNYWLWLQGSYNYQAMASIVSMFGGKDKEPLEYPPEPVDLYGDEAEERAERARIREEQKQLKKAEEWMANMTSMFSGIGVE